jgi:hypothetical protein
MSLGTLTGGWRKRAFAAGALWPGQTGLVCLREFVVNK